MRPNNVKSVLVQKYPEYRVRPLDHPCVNNTRPVYIEMRDRDPLLSSKHAAKGNDTSPIKVKAVPNPVTKTTVPLKTAETGNQVDNKPESISTEHTVNDLPELDSNPVNEAYVPICLPGDEEIETISASQEKAEVPPPEFDIFKDEYELGELLDLKITEIPFLLEKVIPCNSLVILAGHSDVGKSTLYTQLAMDIIKGKSEFLGLKLNAIHQRVLIVSTEDGPIPFAHRVLKQTIDEPIGAKEKSNCKVYFNLDRLEFRIEKHLQINPVDLVIIDAFGDVFTGEINASNVVRQFFNRYIKIIQQYKCSILFVHHICKGDQKKKQQDKDQLLGSTSIAGKVRNVIMLSNKNDQPKLEIVKGNYLSKEDKKRAYYLSFDTNTLTFSVNNEQVSPSKVVTQTGTPGSDYRSENRQIGRKRNDAQYEDAIEFFKQGMQQKEIAKRLNRDKSTISRWIKRYKSTLGYNTQDIGLLP